MELSRRKNLFVVNPTSPMVFCFTDNSNLTPAEKDKTEGLILENGGLMVEYNDYMVLQDQGCILLAKEDDEPPSEDNVFNVSFVEDCVKEQRILDITNYKLGVKGKNFCTCVHTRSLTGRTDCCIFTNGVLELVHDKPQNREAERTPQSDLLKILKKLKEN